jgi:hypothetical protein
LRIEPSKDLPPRQHRLKPAPGTAGAQIVSPKLLDQFLVAMDDAQTLLDRCFGVESPAGVCSTAQKQ